MSRIIHRPVNRGKFSSLDNRVPDNRGYTVVVVRRQKTINFSRISTNFVKQFPKYFF